MENKNQSFHSIQEHSVLIYLDKMWKLLPIFFSICVLIETALFIFVNGNPLIQDDNNFLDKTKEEFMKVLEVNLVGPFLLIQKLYKVFLVVNSV